MAVKDGVLINLKNQWKAAVVEQFKTEPDKVKNSDIKKNAKDIMNNPIVRINAKMVGITLQDIERVLGEIKQEVIEGK